MTRFPTLARKVTLGAGCFLLFTTPVFSITGDQVIERYLSNLGFAEAVEAVRLGDPVLANTATAVGLLLSRPAWVTDTEGEILIECLLSRELGSGVTERGVGDMLSMLVAHFSDLSSWSLRALVLQEGSKRSIPALSIAVLESGHRIASILRDSKDGIVAEPYEREAVVLGRVGPHYPSVELAELLRTVAMYSINRDVVDVTRAGALAIILQMSIE